jgi:hypothetical protein
MSEKAEEAVLSCQEVPVLLEKWIDDEDEFRSNVVIEVIDPEGGISPESL